MIEVSVDYHGEKADAVRKSLKEAGSKSLEAS